VARTLERELGGFLLGNRCRCPNTGREYITIDQCVEAEYTESTDVSLTFKHESWARLDSHLTGKLYGKRLLGWYHSHPKISIFLSEADLALHRARFSEPWMVALVLEPEKHIGGFFVWKNGEIDPNSYVNFYELLDSEKRESVVAWTNYHGVDPVHSTTPTISTHNTQSRPGHTPVWLDEKTGSDTRFVIPISPIDPPPRPSWLKTTVVAIVFMLLGGAIYYLYDMLRTQPDDTVVVQRNSAITPLPPVGQPTPSIVPSPTPQATERQPDVGSRHGNPPRDRRSPTVPIVLLSPEEVTKLRLRQGELKELIKQKESDFGERSKGMDKNDPEYQALEEQKKTEIRPLRTELNGVVRKLLGKAP
jgi:proteasome lid subunit RPN8/RPN11